MKRLILILALLLVSSSANAAQQTILGGAAILWGNEKVKINSNYTELYNQAATKWVTATVYTANNQSVTHGGHVFVCTSNHTSGASTEPGTGADWATVWKYHGSDLYAAALGDQDNYVTDAEKTRIGELESTDIPVFAGADLGVANTTTGLLRFYGNAKAFSFGLWSQGADGTGIGWRLPSAMATGDSVIGVDTNGYLSYLPSTAIVASGFNGNLTTGDDTVQEVAQKLDDLSITGGYTNLTSFIGQTAWRVFYSNTDGDVTELALGADGTYLKSNGATSAPTWATPSGSGDMLLGTPQTVTALKMFDPSTFGIKGSSTGTTTFSSANTGATSYALVFPAADGTLARLSDIPASATGLPFTPAGTIAATTTQAAIEEVSGDITALPALTIQTTAITTGANNILGSDYGLIADTDGDGLPNKVDLAAAGTVQTDANGAVSSVAAASSAEINTGTDTTKPVTADALSGSNLGIEPVGWMIKNSATATAVADGTEAFVVPASMDGRNLVDVTAATASPNGGTGGSTTVVIRRVRTTAAMGDATSQYDLTFSTPNVTITWDGTGTDPGIANTAASLQAGDEVDITGFDTAANNGHWTIATVGANYITFANAAGVENLNDIGVTITPTKHRDMTSTGATVAYTEYSANDETVDTGYDDIATGDRIYVDVTGITTTAGAKGLSVTSSFQLP